MPLAHPGDSCWPAVPWGDFVRRGSELSSTQRKSGSLPWGSDVPRIAIGGAHVGDEIEVGMPCRTRTGTGTEARTDTTGMGSALRPGARPETTGMGSGLRPGACPETTGMGSALRPEACPDTTGMGSALGPRACPETMGMGRQTAVTQQLRRLERKRHLPSLDGAC